MGDLDARQAIGPLQLQVMTGAHLRQRAHQLTLLTTGQAEAPPQQALR